MYKKNNNNKNKNKSLARSATSEFCQAPNFFSMGAVGA